jgi:signal transduction protein with GAF and PtsI domain
MFGYGMDVYAKERYQDLLEEAARERLVRVDKGDAKASQPWRARFAIVVRRLARAAQSA